LVDALPGATLFDLGAIQVELEALLGVPVDVLTPGDLPARFRDVVVREAVLHQSLPELKQQLLKIKS
jgi:predicted nucleotidyltransferase